MINIDENKLAKTKKRNQSIAFWIFRILGFMVIAILFMILSFIVSKGISVTPWIGAAFGIISLLILAINSYLKKNREQNCNHEIQETEFLAE